MSVLTATKAPRSFGIALVAMGVVMLVVGIIYHLQFMHGLRGSSAIRWRLLASCMPRATLLCRSH
jgi:hypothetical protein